SERGPGAALWLPLLGCLAVATLLPALTGTWPAWRAAGRPPVELLRGAELHATGRSASRPRRGGLARLGARLVAARRVRLTATLGAGRRLRGNDEAEVGSGLAQALGLSVSSTLALALPSGGELRLRVAGIVSALDHDGRVAYVPASALLAHDPAADEQIAVRL